MRRFALGQFAVVLPILVLIVVGAELLGNYGAYSRTQLRLAVEAARWASAGYEPSVRCPRSWASSRGLQCYVLQQELRPESPRTQVWIYQPAGARRYRRGEPVRVCVLSTIRYPSPVGDLTSTVAGVATVAIAQTEVGRSLPYADSNPRGRLPAECPAG